MRIYRRFEDGPWWCDFRHQGRRIRQSSGTTDRQAAQEWADRLKAQIWRQDRLGERLTVTWDTAVLDWLEAHKDLRTLSDRKDQLRFASKYLAGKPLTAIDREMIEQIARKKGATVKPATVNRHLAAISAVLGHARIRGWLDTLPPIPRRDEPKTRIRWATEQQAEKLLAALPAEWAARAEFSLATGLRRKNVTHLKWSEVDTARAIAWVHADEAKGKRTIAVPLNARALELLAAQKGKHAKVVFPSPRVGRAVQRLEAKTWRAACKAAGLSSFRWHDLRHTWASWHVQRGTPLPVLQELGGWSSYSMVLKYAHLAPSHIAAYADNSGLRRVRKRAHSIGKERPARAA